ncbi:MAG: hypothetical protein WC763_00290 [Candidatus Paceibacterota bacterium]|jgi:hypothetical protein
MKKQILVSISILVAFFATVSASAEGGFFSFDVWDKYVTADSGLAYDNPVLQTYTSKDIGKGFYAGLFTSVADKKGYGNEVDLSLGRSWGDTVQYDVSVSYWNISELDRTNSDLWVLTLDASKEVLSGPISVTIGACLESYVPMEKSFWTGGYRGTLRTSVTKELVKDKLSLNGEVSLMRDDGSLGSNPSFVAGLSGSLAWTVGRFTIMPIEVKVTEILSNVSDGRKDRIVLGAGMSTTF